MLGAAAFLIAEYLKIGYLEVLRMAAVPTVLYYASLLFMVELDQRRIGAGNRRIVHQLTLRAARPDLQEGDVAVRFEGDRLCVERRGPRW